MFYSLLAVGFVVSIQALCPPLNGYCAILYENSDCGGGSYKMTSANYPWIGAEFNDKTTTLQVRQGCTVELFDDSSFDKKMGEFTGGFHHLRPDFNDRVSSATCYCP